MRIRLNEAEKQRSLGCDCLHNNIFVESLVVVLTLVSALAVTGENLITFNLITVPQYVSNFTRTNGNVTLNSDRSIFTEKVDVMNILLKVFHFTSLGIAGLFFVEIFFKFFTVQKKCFTKVWQIFDALVVVATLTLELVFHFMFFSERALSCLTYIVLLRLWRLHMLCNIYAYAIQEDSHCDNELYRSGRQKAEEKCRMLENTVLQHAETIRKLERLLHNNGCSEQSDGVISDCLVIKNGHPFHKPSDINDISAQYKSGSSSTARRTSNSNSRSYPQKQSLNIHHKEKETPLTITSQVDIPTPLYQLQSQTNGLPHKGTTSENTKLCKNINSKTIDCEKSHSDCMDGAVKNTAQSPVLQSLDTSTASLVTSSQKTHFFLRQRKRRSSASEILDYSSINCSDTGFCESEKTSSCRSFAPDHDKFSSNDKQNQHFNSNTVSDHDSERSINTITDSRDSIVSMALEDKKSFEGRRRTRRFLSCPEYVFTQRMNITNDESMLIDDGNTTADHMVYSNFGFDLGENSSFQVVAEYDGTKTYRNEDGIPMTSL